MQLGDLDGAQTVFVKVIADHPDNADARFNLGNALFNKGQYQAAADSYREANRLNPNLAHAHYNLGMALLRLKDPDAAHAEFKAAEGLDPKLTPPK
jgi:tetratricopeptide (TPR) repeat protein